MSYFSNALSVALEGRRLLDVAAATGIAQPQISAYRNGTKGISTDSLEKLIQAFAPADQAALVIAHLRDQTPPSFFEHIRISAPDVPVEESPASYGPTKELLAEVEYITQRARVDADVRALIRDIARVI